MKSASGPSSARKPVSGAAKSAAGNNGKPAASTTSAAANKKKTTEKGKTNGKDAAAPPPSAWGSAPPGFAAPKQPQVGLSDHHQRVLRHRALFAFRFFVGKAVEVQLDDASVYTGVLDCVDPDDFSIVLKNTRRKSENGEAFQSGSTVIFKRQQIVHLSVDGVVNYNEGALGAAAVSAAAGGFRTDTEISGRHHDHLFGRELQSANSWLDPKLDIGELEDPRRRSSKSGWNQFEANEKLFGVVSSYDENIYTTKLDKSKISTQQSREAERIALEIERQTSTNFHLQEERGHQSAHHDDNLDEEARYSSVDRKYANAPSSSMCTRPSEWMYDNLAGMDEAEVLPQGYMAYGIPMVPNAAVMQPHMYPQMVPQQNMRMMGGGGGQRPHGGGYGYQQPPPYNPRGYYPQHNGGVPGKSSP
uniref:LsmAD domain-containing protein n=1 Tax=Globisporangium ultimum (strain ATCC 200006 / CBS 805.95 / DAOM BR144) TaxID=431595 RepID=K3WV04_GLOUD